ncbi:hypothetical protein V6N13_001148 [Hibiscus sabdariffa]
MIQYGRVHEEGVTPAGHATVRTMYVHSVCPIQCGAAYRSMVHSPGLNHDHPHRWCMEARGPCSGGQTATMSSSLAFLRPVSTLMASVCDGDGRNVTLQA